MLAARPPQGELRVERYEAAIADYALLAPDEDTVIAHPDWLVFGTLRSMGLSIDELLQLAGLGDDDVLMIGSIEVEHARPLLIEHSYTTRTRIVDVDRRTAGDGAVLDRAVVVVDVFDQPEELCGSVRSTYLFKRATR